jgi:hypothetical protein
MSEERIQKVLEFPLPQTVKDVRSFIGLATYFSDHVPNFQQLLRPLIDMVVEQQRKPEHENTPSRKLSRTVVQWDPERARAFEEVKSAVEYCTTLFFLNDIDEVFLLTDASDYGIGAYLYQLVDGKEGTTDTVHEPRIARRTIKVVDNRERMLCNLQGHE